MPKKVTSKKKIAAVRLDGSRYSLKRERDGAGDTGMLWPLHPKKGAKQGEIGEVRVGYRVFCGAWRATMFGADTYWITTPVAEILEVGSDNTHVRFRTVNGSLYEAKAL